MNKSDGDVQVCIDMRKANKAIVRGQKAFERLKQLMSSSNALAYFQNECKTRIVADTGPDSLGQFYYNCMGRSGEQFHTLRGTYN